MDTQALLASIEAAIQATTEAIASGSKIVEYQLPNGQRVRKADPVRLLAELRETRRQLRTELARGQRRVRLGRRGPMGGGA